MSPKHHSRLTEGLRKAATESRLMTLEQGTQWNMIVHWVVIHFWWHRKFDIVHVEAGGRSRPRALWSTNRKLIILLNVVILLVETTKSQNNYCIVIIYNHCYCWHGIVTRYIAVTISLITPQQKGFEDCESHHCKQQSEYNRNQWCALMHPVLYFLYWDHALTWIF